MTLPRPDNLQIAHLEYALEWTDKPILLDGRLCSGLWVITDQKITIDQSQPPQQQVETLLHEALHAMHSENDISDETLKTMSEEELTGKMSKAWSLLLQSNPGAIGWCIDNL